MILYKRFKKIVAKRCLMTQPWNTRLFLNDHQEFYMHRERDMPLAHNKLKSVCIIFCTDITCIYHNGILHVYNLNCYHLPHSKIHSTNNYHLYTIKYFLSNTQDPTSLGEVYSRHCGQINILCGDNSLCPMIPTNINFKS